MRKIWLVLLLGWMFWPGIIMAQSCSNPQMISDDFTGSKFNTEKLWAWTDGGKNGSVTWANGQLGLNAIAGGSTSKGVSISSIKLLGDFVAEVSLKDYFTTGNKLTSNFFLVFNSPDWMNGVNILKSNLSLVVSSNVVGVGWSGFETLALNDRNTPIRVKIERVGATFYVSYKYLDGAYVLAKQYDNYYSGVGFISVGVDNWGPDFPDVVGVIDDFSLKGCELKSGDANQDGAVNLMDFSIWKNEYLNIFLTKKADLNNDGIINLTDFTIWKQAYLAG